MKSHYSEAEAAVALGITLEEFRALIRRHIVDGDEDMANVSTATYQPSDLLVLRMILNGLCPPRQVLATEPPGN
ncbi:MAG: hypothetical protein NZV14_17040 [Bryobacteraceae bacterium]|nr:hypothetical protein [Bryobacteraceae bacterium]MDW8379869.1 hypothetical protein [Bryobacterales bacterium]